MKGIVNKIKIIILILLSITYSGCSTDCCIYKTTAKIYLINESSSVVKSSDSRCFDYEIQPGETIIHEESFENEYSSKPSIENYQPFPTCYLFYYLANSKCETTLTDLNSYEDVKEISDLNFELTFRFTDEKMNLAQPCN